MQIILNHSSMQPIYDQLLRQIKAEIAAGHLTAGEALPSVRALAAELQISALTVKKAYDRLEEEGAIVTVHGKGSYVAEQTPEQTREALRRELEGEFETVLQKARSAGMSAEEIRQLLDLLLEEEPS